MAASRLLQILLIPAAIALLTLQGPAVVGGRAESLPSEEEQNEDKNSENEKPKKTVDEWLRLGPLSMPFPAFSDEGKSRPKAAELLTYAHVDRERLRPAAGESMNMAAGEAVEWATVSAEDGRISIETDPQTPQVAYFAAYVEVPRWMKCNFEVNASHAFELWVDGRSIAKRDKPGNEPQSGEAKLVRGQHFLLVKTVFIPADSVVDWTLGVGVSAGKEFDVALATFSTNPERTMTIHDVLGGPEITDLRISPDGELLALSFRTRRAPDGDADSWVEIRRLDDGALVQTLRDVSGANFRWAPDGHRLSYVSRKEDDSTVRVIDIDTGESETIVEAVKDLSGYEWSPNGTFIAYAINKKPDEKKNKTGVQRLRRVSDRRAGDRNRSSVYVASVPAGTTRRLTAGEHSVSIYDIHPSGEKMLVGRTYEDLSNRPYSISELWILDISGHEPERLATLPWVRGAMWSPDGRQILVTAGPSAFDGIGANVPEGRIPNDYDTQAFLLDPETKDVDPITRDFDPTVQSVFWPKAGKEIICIAGEGEYVRMFRYNVRERTFKPVELDCDVIHKRDVAANARVAAVVGSAANRPPRLYAIDLKRGRARELMFPASERFEDVLIGDVETWRFTTSSGQEIAGRIHFPPDFDPSKKWPCIVYYYGGTSPVTRDFGGRYPKNLWTGHGYVVYVLQPSGATGFGQAFSSKHVNDWGKIVAGEIIEGVEKFLDAHDFVDRERVGCIGASFGGFMTQLLVTKTDMFAAAVSHAGISMISSYWGEGYWGYAYNAVSAAESFPWNRPDIYIDQSPLFGVENVTTPLLLLHGKSDTNVPPGESEQMYTALKLLGKEVEYIRVEEQNHLILDYKKRVVWNNAIISWFDRWLKDEPEWWNDMYPPLEKEAAEDK